MILSKEYLEQALKIKTISEIKDESKYSMSQLWRKIIEFNLELEFYTTKTLKAIEILKTQVKCKCIFCDKIILIDKRNVKRKNGCGCQKNYTIQKQQLNNEYVNNFIYSEIKGQAKERKIEFNISQKYINDLYLKQNKKCALSALNINFPVTNVKNVSRNKTASLDRINSNIGYIEGNVQWIHKDINFMKHSLTEGQFMQYCKAVINTNKKNNKNIVIWGGAGFIGTKLTEQLLYSGYNVTVLDNLFKGGDGLLPFISNPNFKFKFANITNINHIKESFEEKVDGIILLSGLVGLDICRDMPFEAEAVNNIGWKMLCENKPKEIPLIAASTGSVYGKLDSICTENSPTNPLSVYGITKLAGEKHVINCGGTALRFATAGGVSNQMRLNLLPNTFCYQAITQKYINLFEPEVMRTFIDIRDFVDSLIFALENKNQLKYQIYNVGSNENNLSKGDLAKIIKDKTGCYLTYCETGKDQDARDYSCDYSRINEAGFKCKYTIHDMIDNLLKTMPLLKLESKYQ